LSETELHGFAPAHDRREEKMNETPAEQLGEHILEIVKAVVDEYPDAPDNAIVEIIKERCEHELDEGELERFYADAYKWQTFARR
jgi:flagellar biosynthesis/type III secretory pathway protein FliH